MTEPKKPEIHSDRTHQQSHELDANIQGGDSTHTRVHGADLKVPDPKIDHDASVVEKAQEKPDDPDAAAKDGLA
ncbi:hypothetical protein IPV08_22965 [Methylobacterium sp. SD274]|uniref:hypothetical protein n=1 Tax=unclassified Methylobacterium TaxID=2615210 RepID=UPI00037B393F|nr:MULTISPECIES: hypothetical protein [unclassified Methylobacterium]MBO1022824.1 hypothetical protein [Methylobacterium sp. SD274]